MSQIPPVSGPSDDAHPLESRGSLERKRPHVDEDSSSADGRESVHSRRPSWHPSAPVEPPLKSLQHRSIGVHSILNHPAKAGAGTQASVDAGGREGLQEQSLNSPSHSRFSSSSTVHLPSPSMHPAKRPSLSPGSRNHQSVTPSSPSARFVGAGGYYPVKPGVSQSPLSHDSLPGVQTVAPNSPLTVDSVSGHQHPIPGHQPPVSVHSTPTFRTSTNQTPNQSSKETSPTTPISAYSQLGRSSPAVAAAAAPTPLYMTSSPYGAVDPVTRIPSVVAGQRNTGDETIGMGGSQPDSGPLPGMIPCFLDLKSGSSSQAEKRKANSDASRRFRNRKRNEMQMEQKITAQQEEIRKQAEAIQSLVKQRDFYRSERDFFRDHFARLVPSGQVPTRPTSPRSFQTSFETTSPDRDRKTSWSGPDARELETTTGSAGHPPVPGSLPTGSNLPTTRPPGTWSVPPSQYPPPQPDRAGLPDERQARPLTQTSGTWPRS